MTPKETMFAIYLFFLLLILQPAHSLPQSKMQQDRHPDYIITRPPSTTTSTMYNDRVSVLKCQEYVFHHVTEKIYVDYETDITTEIIEDIETTTEKKEISHTQQQMPGEIRESTEKVEEAKTTSKNKNATVIENAKNYTENNTILAIANLKHTSEKNTLHIEKVEETIGTNIGTNKSYWDIVPAIAGGESATLGEYPYMTAIGWVNTDGSYAFDCGGTLISPLFVLTAAHCAYSHAADNPIPSVVRLGDQNINSSEDDKADPVQVNIKTIYKHPQYTRKKHYNDIALLELEREVNFDEDIEPACLWSSRELSYYTRAIAIGWGVVDPYTDKRSNELQKVILPLLSNEMCDNLLLNHINRKWNKGFLDTQLCAGEPRGGKDTCQGDSGSPLQIPSRQNHKKYYVIGITSFGPKFCAQLPAVYTRVSSYLDWIESIVWPEEYKAWLNSSTY